MPTAAPLQLSSERLPPAAGVATATATAALPPPSAFARCMAVGTSALGSTAVPQLPGTLPFVQSLAAADPSALGADASAAPAAVPGLPTGQRARSGAPGGEPPPPLTSCITAALAVDAPLANPAVAVGFASQPGASASVAQPERSEPAAEEQTPASTMPGAANAWLDMTLLAPLGGWTGDTLVVAAEASSPQPIPASPAAGALQAAAMTRSAGAQQAAAASPSSGALQAATTRVDIVLSAASPAVPPTAHAAQLRFTQALAAVQLPTGSAAGAVSLAVVAKLEAEPAPALPDADVSITASSMALRGATANPAAPAAAADAPWSSTSYAVSSAAATAPASAAMASMPVMASMAPMVAPPGSSVLAQSSPVVAPSLAASAHLPSASAAANGRSVSTTSAAQPPSAAATSATPPTSDLRVDGGGLAQAADDTTALPEPLSVDPAPLLNGAPIASPAAAVSTPAPAPTTSDLPQWPPLDIEQLPSELGERLQWMNRHEVLEVSLQIEPPDMGPLRVQLKLQDGGLAVLISGDQPQTLQLIQSAVPALREQLQQGGLQLIELQTQASQSQAGGRDAQQPPSPPQLLPTADDTRPAATSLQPAAKPASAAAELRSTQRLDTWV